MKKYLLFTVLLIASGSLMAQNVTVAPFDNPLTGKLNPALKSDSAWRTVLPPLSTDKLLKQGNINFNKLPQQNQLLAQLNTNSNIDKMPVVVLEGRSNMPVKKIEGYYTMPVAGNDKAKKSAVVTP